jgi:platelet-activating factor acetylhydrolase IB subunit alpha
MGLTKDQKDELNKAILEYLYNNGYGTAYDGLITDTGIDPDDAQIKTKNMLENKWKAVARLKRQVLSLEDQIQRYKEENDFGVIAGEQKEGLPKQPEKHELIGHRNKVTRVAFHPIYDVLASCSEDASIKLWDTETGENDKTLRGHTKKINSIAFNNQGNMMVSTSMDMSIKLWNMEVHQCIKTMKGHEHNIPNAKFMPAGDQVVSCSWDNTLKLWDCGTGYCLKTYKGHDNWVTNLDINTKGTRMVS